MRVEEFKFKDEMEKAVRSHFLHRAEARGLRRSPRVRVEIDYGGADGVETHTFSSLGEKVVVRGIPGSWWKIVR